MRNAEWGSAWEVVLLLSIAACVLVGVGFAVCKVMGWERKVLGNYIGIVFLIGLSFLVFAHFLSQFF